MKERLTISISTIRGSLHWQLTKSMSYIVISLFAINVTVLFSCVLLILHLYKVIDFAQAKQIEFVSESKTLDDELKNLQQLKKTLESKLSDKESYVTIISERFSHLEKVLGISKQEVNDDLESRLDRAILSSMRIETLENELSHKNKNIEIFSERISNLEKLLEMFDQGADDELDSRLDNMAIQSNLKITMLTQIPSGSPVNKYRISSEFGMRTHPITKKKKMHKGLDFAVNTGTLIYAPADGIVEETRLSSKGSGNFLRLQHSYGFSSSYSHLKSFKVKDKQFVRKGELIALSGNTGLSSGPHLHYEIHFVGQALNPRPFIEWDIHKFQDIFKKERAIQWESLIKTVKKRVVQQLQPSSPKDVLSAENLN